MIMEDIIEFDNQEIYGLVYLPDESKNYPFVILSHGLSLDHSYMQAYAEKLLKHGIASYIYDFQGGGYDSKSTGKICDMTISSECTDLCRVIEHIKSTYDISSLYLAGHSQGGLVSSLVASDNPGITDALFLFAPAYEIPDDMIEQPPRQMNVLNLMPEHLGAKYIDDAKNIKVYEIIKNFNKRVYIFHGQCDRRVPLSYSQKASEVFPDCKLICYPDEEHRFTDDTKDDVVEIIADYIYKS